MHVKSDMICFCLFVYFYSCKNNGVRAQGRGEGRGAWDCCFWRIVGFFGWEELGAALMVLTAFWKRGWRGLLLYEGAAACFVCVHICVCERLGGKCVGSGCRLFLFCLFSIQLGGLRRRMLCEEALLHTCVCACICLCQRARRGVYSSECISSLWMWMKCFHHRQQREIGCNSAGLTEQQLQGAWAHTHTLIYTHADTKCDFLLFIHLGKSQLTAGLTLKMYLNKSRLFSVIKT